MASRDDRVDWLVAVLECERSARARSSGPYFEYRNVLLEHVDEWIDRGWRPANNIGDAVGAVPFSGGTVASVLIFRERDGD